MRGAAPHHVYALGDLESVTMRHVNERNEKPNHLDGHLVFRFAREKPANDSATPEMIVCKAESMRLADRWLDGMRARLSRLSETSMPKARTVWIDTCADAEDLLMGLIRDDRDGLGDGSTPRFASR